MTSPPGPRPGPPPGPTTGPTPGPPPGPAPGPSADGGRRDLASDPVRWGVAGPGGIARKVVHDLVTVVDGGVLHAVGSRSLERAEAFAAELAPEDKVATYGSYRELFADPEVEAVYIATPHRQHAVLALQAIDAGKAVLVEKAFTCTLDGAQRVVDAARANGVFAMEAMWTRFQPAVVRVRDLIAQGAIGEVRSVRADLGLVVPFDPKHRLWDLRQGGGALLDLGVYPVSWVQMVLAGGANGATADQRRFTDVRVSGLRGPNGADMDAALLLTSFDGRRGVAECSLRTRLPGTAEIRGGQGRIEIPPRFHHPQRIVVHPREGDGEAEPVVEEHPALGGGYAHQLIEVQECLAAGRTESAVMPLDDTLAVMDALERALHDLGIRFTEDGL